MIGDFPLANCRAKRKKPNASKIKERNSPSLNRYKTIFARLQGWVAVFIIANAQRSGGGGTGRAKAAKVAKERNFSRRAMPDPLGKITGVGMNANFVGQSIFPIKIF